MMQIRKSSFLYILISLILTSILLYFVFFNNSTTQNSNESFVQLYPVGQVKNCAINPEFPGEYGLNPPYFIDLRQKGYRGLRIIEAKENGKILQLPEWSQFGWLGLYTLDNSGNLYLSSVPNESIVHNPVGEQNRILKINSKNGEMTEFMQLPQKNESSLNNPFGAMGLHFDCDNGYIYVSSVAGSTMKQPMGSIFQVDIGKKEIISILEYIDAIGLSTFNTIHGKRLFFGMAREPKIYSISIDKEGKITGTPKFEISLIDVPGGAFDKAHRIKFKGNIMEVRANDFNFTLAAASDPETNLYRFSYNTNTDSWDFIDVKRVVQ